MSKINDFLRYTDRSMLCNYPLNTEFFDKYGLEVYEAHPIRSVFLLNTDKGFKILKLIDYTKEELSYINEAIDYVKDGYSNIISFYKTLEGNSFEVYNDNLYSIFDVVEGRECEYSNPIDIEIASKGLAKFHKASNEFKTSLTEKIYLGQAIEKFKSRVQSLEDFKNIAISYKNKMGFDKLFLKNVDDFIKQGKLSIELLEKSPYLTLCADYNNAYLCHHDLAHHNMLICEEEVWFIDFDYSIVDLRVHDICNFMNKTIKNYAFDMDKAKLLIDSYNSENPLKVEEIEVLKALITFPHDFYSIVSDYYTRNKSWDYSVFYDRLQKKLEFKEERIEFLENFDKLFN